MNEEELRAKLSRALRKEFLDATWERFWRDCYVEEYLGRLNMEKGEKKKKTWEELTDLAESPLTYQNALVREVLDRNEVGLEKPERLRRGNHERGVGESSLTQYESEYTEILAEVFAKHTADYPEVKDFRGLFLGGEHLTPEQAQAFLDSPANATLEISWFKEHGVAFVGHEAKIMSSEQMHGPSGAYELLQLSVSPPGVLCEVRRGSNLEEYRDVYTSMRHGAARAFRNRDTSYYRAGSPLDTLRFVILRVITRSDVRLSPSQATWLVLTGEPPELFTLECRSGNATITLRAVPWLSSKSVERAFRAEQTKLLSKGRRRPLEKNSELLRFVTARIDFMGRRPEGRLLVAEWNRMHPQWAYINNTRQFWRDYNLALGNALQMVAPRALQRRKRPDKG